MLFVKWLIFYLKYRINSSLLLVVNGNYNMIGSLSLVSGYHIKTVIRS